MNKCVSELRELSMLKKKDFKNIQSRLRAKQSKTKSFLKCNLKKKLTHIKKHSEKNSLLVPHSRLTSILFKPNGNMPLHYTFLST